MAGPQPVFFSVIDTFIAAALAGLYAVMRKPVAWRVEHWVSQSFFLP